VRFQKQSEGNEMSKKLKLVFLKSRLLSGFGILAMLLGQIPVSVFAAPPAPARIYLPLVATGGQPSPLPASPYATALSQALARCAATALNQVCYAGGSLTLTGGGPLTTPGQAAALDGVSGLKLISPDASHFSVALLRLAADSATPDLGLTVLAFGNVEIQNLTLFTAAAANGDAAPALSFSSSPVPGADPITGGLIVHNPSHEDPLSITLNGADLTLASSAVVQAQPGAQMTVTNTTGTVLVQTNAGEAALPQAHQSSILLDNAGKAVGAPTPPSEIEAALLVPLVPSNSDDENLLVPLVRPAQDMRALLLADFDRAHKRCMQGSSRHVYNVFYWARFLKEFKLLSDDEWLVLDIQIRQCARFEIEFNSEITGSSSTSAGSTHVRGQGMIVSFDFDGQLVSQETMPITHLNYNFTAPPICPYQTSVTDGALHMTEASLRINGNNLEISTTIQPVAMEEYVRYTCDGMQMPQIAAFARWRMMFLDLHKPEQLGFDHLYKLDNWKYLSGEIFAESIFADRQAAFYDGVSSESMWMFMLHKPGGL
jgi:hypothetical protein